MFFNYIDFLSPKITLYQQGILSHSSIISGILSLLTVISVISMSIIYLIDFLGKKNPTSYFYQRFVQDAGEYQINNSSFLHYISMLVNISGSSVEKFDFNSFQIIGIEVNLGTYIHVFEKNINLLDHWLYGPCQESLLKELSNTINETNFLNSACIRKYYNSYEKKYYDINEEHFRWPKMKYGTFNSNNEFYNVIIEKCKDNILNIIMGNDNHCRTDEEINDIIEIGSAIYFYFLDSYIDVLDYYEPIHKFVFKVDNALDKDNYSTNHLNFRPSVIKTYDGLITNNYKEETSLEYERNDVFTNPIEGSGIYINYYFWLKNRIQYYGRVYDKLQDIISDIGGAGKLIAFIFSLINYLFNQYKTLTDTMNLFNLYNDSSERDRVPKKKIKLNDENNIKITDNNKSSINLNSDPTKNDNSINQNNNNIYNLQKDNNNLSNLPTSSKIDINTII